MRTREELEKAIRVPRVGERGDSSFYVAQNSAVAAIALLDIRDLLVAQNEKLDLHTGWLEKIYVEIPSP